jgi:hypothetical protein
LDTVRTFGCLAYAFTPKQLRVKYEAKVRVCMNLGAAQEYRAYRLYDLSTGKVIISRHVRFIEHNFPAIEQSSPSQGENSSHNPPLESKRKNDANFFILEDVDEPEVESDYAQDVDADAQDVDATVVNAQDVAIQEHDDENEEQARESNERANPIDQSAPAHD